jgi:hypothetical protein
VNVTSLMEFSGIEALEDFACVQGAVGGVRRSHSKRMSFSFQTGSK